MLKAVAFTLAFVGVYLAVNQAGILFANPCKEPIAYRIGSFDAQFDLSESSFLMALKEAEAIWETPIGKELFVYEAEEGDLPINLVYDYRQETTDTLKVIGNVLEVSEATYTQMEARYETEKKQYNSIKNSYEQAVAAFNSSNTTYQSHVDAWNSGPRNSKSEFNKLSEERKVLEQQVANIKSLESDLNLRARELNALVEQLNRTAGSLNKNVDVYNSVGQARGESFTGGLYYSDSDKEGIDIYEFSDHEKLVRILAHELGHALGLEHVDDDPKAIMYYFNEGDVILATNSDILALKQLCGIE